MATLKVSVCMGSINQGRQRDSVGGKLSERDAPVLILASPTTTTLTTATPLPATPTPQPTTSHAEQRQGNEEEKASSLTIREALLQNIEKGNEDVDSDDELVMLTKRRLKNLLSSRCSCPDPAFDYSFEPNVYENTIIMHYTTCNFKNTSQPEKVRAGRQKKSIIRTNISMTGGGGTRSLMCLEIHLIVL
ncbi:hypothetical protein E2C01_041698 [Portunus trituberculatus]|uniref:Uncharacterized protein n=1 Tax=Portunus trituberculatus TaxID=210409 RepID=A0A5B7FRE6_PORTR|nr:hypothetical protein [Portunus trituberculatus]